MRAYCTSAAWLVQVVKIKIEFKINNWTLKSNFKLRVYWFKKVSN